MVILNNIIDPNKSHKKKFTDLKFKTKLTSPKKLTKITDSKKFKKKIKSNQLILLKTNNSAI